MGSNLSRRLAQDIAAKRRLEQERKMRSKVEEHSQLSEQAVGSRKALEKEIGKKSLLDMLMPYSRIALASILVPVFIVIAVSAFIKLKQIRENRYAISGDMVLNPYRCDSDTRSRAARMESEIPDIIEKGKSAEMTRLKSQIPVPVKFDIVAFTRTDKEISAIVEFLGDGDMPVQAIFNWDSSWRFKNIKY